MRPARNPRPRHQPAHRPPQLTPSVEPPETRAPRANGVPRRADSTRGRAPFAILASSHLLPHITTPKRIIADETCNFQRRITNSSRRASAGHPAHTRQFDRAMTAIPLSNVRTGARRRLFGSRKRLDSNWSSDPTRPAQHRLPIRDGLDGRRRIGSTPAGGDARSADAPRLPRQPSLAHWPDEGLDPAIGERRCLRPRRGEDPHWVPFLPIR